MGKKRLDSLFSGQVELARGEIWVNLEDEAAPDGIGQGYSRVDLARQLEWDCCFFNAADLLGDRASEVLSEVRTAAGENLAWGMTVDGPFERLVRDKGFMEALPWFREGAGSGVEELLSVYDSLIAGELEAAVAAGTDLLLFCDDLAYTAGPFISPKQFERLLLPRYAGLLGGLEIPVGFHSDGNLQALLPFLQEMGFRFYSLEPEAMDLVGLKQGPLAGDVLMTGIRAEWLLDQVLPGAAPVAVRDYVEALKGDTGLILSSSCGVFQAAAVERLRQVYRWAGLD